MKRLFLVAAGALGACFCFISPASAHPVDSTATSASTVVPASGSPPKAVLTAARVPTLPRYRVVSGDSLWLIGTRTHRTWQALASFNHIPNPNLIFVDQIVTIPPATYVGAASVPAPAPSYTPPPRHQTTYTAPTRTYTPPVSRPVVRSYGAPGSFQACVALRESGNGSGSSNIYGILDSTWRSLGRSGSAWSASRAEQDAAFAQLYAKDGTQPWAPYDGC